VGGLGFAASLGALLCSVPKRLLRVEEHGGVTDSVVSTLIAAPTAAAAEKTFLLFDRLAREVVAYGERHLSHVDLSKTWYRKSNHQTAEHGVAVVVFNDKLQSIMPMHARDWVRIQRNK
jgi:hypothetical protein